MKKGLLWIWLLYNVVAVSAQDTKVSHPFMWKSFNNPGYSGFDGLMRAALGVQRSHWSHPLDLRTYFLAYDYPFQDKNTYGLGGMSLLYQRDQENSLKYVTDMLGVSVSGRVRVSRATVIQVGLQPTLYRKGLDPSRITLGDQFDPFYGQVLDVSPELLDFYADKILMFDVAAGIYGETDFLIGWHGVASLEYGFSVYHIIESTQSFLSEHGSKSSSENLLHRRYSGYVSYSHPVVLNNLSTTLAPYLLMDIQSTMKSFHFGLYWKEERFGMIGLGIKSDQYEGLKVGTMLFHLGLNIAPKSDRGWQLAYTYEVPTNQGTMYQNTTHALSLHWYLKYSPKRCISPFGQMLDKKNRIKGQKRGGRKTFKL